jgi:hypothetical protein
MISPIEEYGIKRYDKEMYAIYVKGQPVILSPIQFELESIIHAVREKRKKRNEMLSILQKM